MKDSDQQDSAFADDEQVQITDLDTEETPQRRRVRRIITILSTTIKTPWSSYGLIGACLLVLIGSLFLQTLKPQPAPARRPTSPALITPEALAATSNRMYVQTGEHILTAYQTTNGQALWSRALPGPASLLATDQAVYGYFIADQGQGRLEGLNTGNGQPLWELALPAAQATDEVVLQQNGMIISLSGIGTTVYNIRRDNGRVAWTSQVPNQETGTLPEQNEIVSVQESTTTIHILNTDDGWEMIHFPTVFDRSLTVIDGPLLSVLPASDPHGGQSIQVFRASDGKPLWTLPLANNTSVINEQDGIIYLRGPNNATLTALRDSDGQRLWSITTSDDQPFINTPVEQAGMLYLIQRDDLLVGIRVSNGLRVWQRQLPPLDEQQGGMQLLLDQGIFLLSTPPQEPGGTQSIKTEAFRASDGSILWQSSQYAGTPLVQAGRLYTLQANGQLDAWQTSDGHHLWHTQVAIGSKLAPGLMLHPSLVFLVNERGEIAALRASNGTLLWNYPTSVT